MDGVVDNNDKIDDAIGRLADQARANPDSQRALHYSQAALNLAHAKSVLSTVPTPALKAAKAKQGE